MDRTVTLAYQVARANAHRFRVPYVVFIDASLGVRVERYDPALSCHRTGTIFYPEG